jgi:hypothetical protein
MIAKPGTRRAPGGLISRKKVTDTQSAKAHWSLDAAAILVIECGCDTSSRHIRA